MKKINMYGLNKSVVRGLENYKITLITKKQISEILNNIQYSL